MSKISGYQDEHFFDTKKLSKPKPFSFQKVKELEIILQIVKNLLQGNNDKSLELLCKIEASEETPIEYYFVKYFIYDYYNYNPDVIPYNPFITNDSSLVEDFLADIFYYDFLPTMSNLFVCKKFELFTGLAKILKSKLVELYQLDIAFILMLVKAIDYKCNTKENEEIIQIYQDFEISPEDSSEFDFMYNQLEHQISIQNSEMINYLRDARRFIDERIAIIDF